MFKKYLYFIIITLIMYSCATTKIVKPLEKGRFVAGASVAVPYLRIPIPLVSLYGAYGISNKISVHTGFNITPLINIDKFLHIDLGGTFGILKQKKFRPGLSAVTNFNFVNDFKNKYFSVFPDLELNAFWEYGKEIDNDKKFMSYLNFINIFDISQYYNNTVFGIIWYPALTIGQQFNRKKIVYNLELKYIFASQPNLELINSFILKHSGSFGIYFGVTYKFNLKKKI